MSGPRQSLAVNLLLSVGVGAGTLALAETWARWREPARPPAPSARALEWKADFYTIKPAAADWPPGREFNRDGIRDRPHAPEKPDGVRRVVCLGDSVTFGPDGHPEQAYPQVLQEKLDAITPGVEVFNVSLWGWATTQERTAYLKIARPYHPDDVILGVCLNDIQDLENELARPPALLAALHRRSALVRRIVDARGREIRGIEELFTEADSPRVRAGLDRLETEILGLKREVEADHARLSVLLFPFRGQVSRTPPPPIIQDRLRAFCLREGLPFLDPLAALQPLGDGAFLEGDGIHLSPAGCARVADTVLASGLLPFHPATPAAADAPGATLIAALADPDPERRQQAAWALGRRGTADADAVAALRRALDDRQERVRAEAAAALQRVRALEARPDLLRALADPRQSVRWRAARALSTFGGPATAEIPTLAGLLSAADAHVAQFAAWAIGESGDAARPALPALVAALHARDLGVRAVSAQTLGRVGPGDPAVLAALSATIEDRSWPERWHAVRALGHAGDAAVPYLIAALRSDDEAVRLEAALALGRLRPRSADPLLAAAEHDPDPEVRAAATKARRRIARR